MIPVSPQPEPANFHDVVRTPGLRWLKENKIDLERPIPPQKKLPPRWRHCLADLHLAYGGICAYLCVFIERCTGGSSVDHFIAKSQQPGLAYEWSNYRLACTTMNARKRDYSTVLDPFQLEPETFFLELVTGRIYPNPQLPAEYREQAQLTIERLRLDDATCREMRRQNFTHYVELRGPARNAQVETWLEHKYPFLWYEANRQGLL
ncbi:MAG: hypothetical protein HC897_04990 [Thermoanaerobaculia bacterium]|nr:hypothetical protein [Thermoanaerobaculia bacterium]